MVRIAELLQRAGLQPWLDRWYLTPGGRWQEELAEGLVASSACAVFIGPTDVGAWEREELAFALDRAAKDRLFRVFLVLLPGLPEPFKSSALSPFLSTRTWVDFRGGPHDPRALQTLVNAIKGIPAGPETPLEPRDKVSPYRGLLAFDEEHAEFFFGRDAEIQRLVEKLKASTFLAVLGPSGSGKSSLARAGLIPALRRGVVPGSESWSISVLRPGAHPVDTLAAHVVSLYPYLAAGRTRDELAADPRTLRLLGSHPPAHGEGGRVLWFVDQCEEVFTLCRDEEERRQFLLNLLHAAVPEGPTTVVLTMRADFYSRCAPYPAFAQQLAAEQFLVGPMDEEQLRQVIEEPAHRVGLEFETGLTETILGVVARQPGALPLLEHALLELWERRRGRMLTLEAYRETGGVEGAISKRADAILATFGTIENEITRRILLRLTEPGDGVEDSRRRAPLSELVTSPDQREPVEAVVRALADARLLTIAADENTGERIVDVSHEALIRAWPKLRRWVDDDRQGLRIHRRLTEAAEEWQRLSRDHGALYRGARLAEALEWEAGNESVLNQLERDFLSASRAAQVNELEAEKGRTRRFRALAAGLAVFLVGALVSAGLAVRQTRRAQNEAAIARSREFASRAISQLSVDPGESLRLAVEAMHTRSTVEAREALRRALAGAPTFQVRVEFRVEDRCGPEAGAVFSPDGTLLVTFGAKTPQVWDAGTGRLVATLVGHKECVFDDPTFSSDGRLIVTEDRTEFRVWEPRTGTSIAILPTSRPGNFNVNPLLAFFSPDEDFLATSDDAGTIIWDTSKWTRIQTFPNERLSEDNDLQVFSPDGRRLALDIGKAFIVRDTRSWRQLGTLSPPRAGQGVYQLTYSPDGMMVAMTSTADDYNFASTTVAILSASGKTIVKPFDLPGQWTSPTFSRDSRLFALFGRGGVTIWRTSDWSRLITRSVEALNADWELGVRERPDGAFEVVDTATDQSVAVLRVPESFVAFSPGANRIMATAGRDGVVRVWSDQAPDVWGPGSGFPPASSEFIAKGRFSPHTEYVSVVAFSADRSAVAVSRFPTILRTDIEVWRPRAKSTLGTDISSYPFAVTFSPDGRFLAAGGPSIRCDSSGCRNGPLEVEVWAASTGMRVATLEGGSESAWSPDGRLMAVWASDPVDPRKMGVRVYDTSSWKLVRAQGGPGDPISGASFSSDGKMIVSLRYAVSKTDGGVFPGGPSYSITPVGAVVWNVADGRVLATVQERKGSISKTAFAPVGDLVVTSRYDEPAYVWHGRTGSKVTQLPSAEAIVSLAFSQDGRLAALTSESPTYVGETAGWNILASFPGRFADFTWDGRLVLTVTDDGVAHVWDARSGERVLEISRPGLLEHPVFGLDGRSIIAVGSDGVVRTFPCPSCAQIDKVLAEAERRITIMR